MAAIFRLLIVAPFAVLVVLLALANREMVRLSLDPLGNNAWSISMPLFVAILGAVMVGLVFGGCATWLGQGRYRRAARERARKLAEAQKEVERLRLLVPTNVAVESNTSSLPATMIR